MKDPASRIFWQTFAGLSALLSAGALYQTVLQANKLGVSLLSSKWAVLLGMLALNLAGGLALVFMSRGGRGARLIDSLELSAPGGPWRAGGVITAGLAMAGFWLLKLDLLAKFLPGLFPGLWFFAWLSLAAAAGLRLAGARSWASSFAAVVILQGVLFVIYGRLRLVSTDPFSLGYSEGGRYYYASLVFAKSIYGQTLELSSFHPSRYLLLAIPFLVEGLPIWAHRLWQALLWIGLTAASSHLLVRRLHLKARGLALLMTGWLILYLFQGPVYYHLQICVILILLGCSPLHPKRTLAAVLAASAWAGISRINWYPVPAMLAISLYLLEEPVSNSENARRYLSRPVLWALLGPLTALLPQRLYDLWWSGAMPTRILGSVQTSPLLFDRLLPNPSFAPGILPGIVFVSLPLWLYLYRTLRDHARQVHGLRLSGLAAIALALFGGGLLVSTKIGGGAELHNMDAYLVVLAIIGTYFLAGRVQAEDGRAIAAAAAPWPVVMAGLIIPLAFSLQQVVPPNAYDRTAAARDLETLQVVSRQTAAAGGQVLFITERQLLTFGLMPGVALVPDYEVATLQEMAMSGNSEYLERFQTDLRLHRFALIVARRQNTALQDEGEEAFAEENNVWNEQIAGPLLCYYEPEFTLTYANVQVFRPRPDVPSGCP